MSLMANCMLNGSPGPSPGAPAKSPAVSLTCPKPPAVEQWPVPVTSLQERPTAPTPWEKFLRLNRLNMSARSWNLIRSVTGIYLITDRSTSLKFGPAYLFRETGEPAQAGSLGLQNEFGLSH